MDLDTSDDVGAAMVAMGWIPEIGEIVWAAAMPSQGTIHHKQVTDTWSLARVVEIIPNVEGRVVVKVKPKRPHPHMRDAVYDRFIDHIRPKL